MPVRSAGPLPAQVFARLADEPGAVWLDGGDAPEGWSILAWSPDEVWTSPRGWVEAGRRMTGAAAPDRLPFTRGVLGYLGYEAAQGADDAFPAPRPPEPPGEPPVWLGAYRGALLWEHATGAWHASGDADVRRRAAALLDDAQGLSMAPDAPPPASALPADRAAFERAVARALDAIAAGDAYQLNLSRPVFVPGPHDAWQVWRRLRAASAPERGAFLRLRPDLAVLSHSPETFLDLRDGHLRTVPIKGTRPRSADDGAALDALLTSEKERAELTMIVDLCRNDLGRVAVPGTVRAGPRRLRSHPYVHHAEQAVEATLAPGLDAWDALTAAFPPGSVTGCPKVAATHLIRSLEPSARGVYCGAIGFVSASGSAAWSVAIRTAVLGPAMARYHVGGGIVADSTPAAEWEETEAKGVLLAHALGVAPYSAPSSGGGSSAPSSAGGASSGST